METLETIDNALLDGGTAQKKTWTSPELRVIDDDDPAVARAESHRAGHAALAMRLTFQDDSGYIPELILERAVGAARECAARLVGMDRGAGLELPRFAKSNTLTVTVTIARADDEDVRA